MTGDGPLEVHAVRGLPEIQPGDDLAGLTLTALERSGLVLADDDILVVSSKVVAKAEGRLVALDGRASGSTDAQAREDAVAGQTARIVAERLTPRGQARIVATHTGLVLAAAGVDASNVPAGHVLLLPQDGDASARRLCDAVRERTGTRIGVLISDTLGRPWRIGQVDTAIGAAGVLVGEDLAGLPDAGGRPMEVTYRALADELAAAADLVKGKVTGVPVALIRGAADLVLPDAEGGDSAGPAAADLVRGELQDWFRYGHAEAARMSLGVGPGAPDLPMMPVVGGDVVERLRRAVDVAMAAPVWEERPGAPRPWVQTMVMDEADIEAVMTAAGEGSGDDVQRGEAAIVVLMLTPGCEPHELVALGALTQRVLVAAWAEDLDAAFVPRFSQDCDNLAVRAVVRSFS